MMQLRKSVSLCFLLLICAAAEQQMDKNFLAPKPASTVSRAASQEDNKLPPHPACTSPYGCFQVNLEASDFMQLSTAKDLPKGIENFGVEATYDSAQYAQSLFAAIQAPSRSQSRYRALFVNVTDPRTPAPESVFCVFDLGAFPVDPDSGRGGGPYLKIAQQHGVECQFKFLKATKPVGIEQSATFVYSLTTLYNTSEACGSESLPVKDASICPSPPQPALLPPPSVVAEEVVEAARKAEEKEYSYKCEARRCVLEHRAADVRKGFFSKKGDCEKSCPGAKKKEMLEEVQEEEEEQIKINSCESTTGCFEVRLALQTTDMHLQDARSVRPGTNYGVAVKYSDSNQMVFATIQDSDGDHLVNVTTGSGRAFCVFDMGAQDTPYLELSQQLGMNCNFELTETRPGSSRSSAPTFVYTLSAEYDASVSCGSASLHPAKPLCPQPPQPKVFTNEIFTVQQGCQSTTGCFEVRLASDTSMKLGDAKHIPDGTNYGVAVKYSGDSSAVFATIQDSDGDHFVSAVWADGSAFCVFDLGAQGTPYVQLAQQKGVSCKFELTATRQEKPSSAPTFVYTLSADYDASVACGSASLHPKKPLCPEPPQPKVFEDATALTVLQI